MAGDGDQVDHEMLSQLNYEAMIDQEDHKMVNGAFDDQVEFLSTSFPEIDKTKLQKKLKECDNDSERAIDEILNEQLLVKMKVEPLTQTQKFSTSKKKKGNSGNISRKQQKQNEQIEFVAEHLNCTLEEAEQKLIDKNWSVGKCLVQVNFTTVVRKNIPEAAPLQPQQNGNMNSAPLPSTKQLHAAPPVRNAWTYHNNVLEANKKDFEDRRDYAVEQLQDMARKSKSNPLYKSATGVYGERASTLSQTVNSYSDEIYFNQIEQQSSAFRIDCHGIPSAVAVKHIEQRLQNWVSQGCKAPFDIVTGSGRHSDGGVSKIKKMVRNRLDKNKFKYDEYGAGFKVTKCL